MFRTAAEKSTHIDKQLHLDEHEIPIPIPLLVHAREIRNVVSQTRVNKFAIDTAASSTSSSLSAQSRESARLRDTRATRRRRREISLINGLRDRESGCNVLDDKRNEEEAEWQNGR